MFKRNVAGFNFFMNTLYANSQPRSETIQGVGGRGNAGTAKFYNDAMRENVAEKERELRDAYLNNLKGHQLEEREAKLANRGVGRSHH